MSLADRLGHLVPSQHHVGVLARALPPVLKCCSMAQRQPGVADTMIEAPHIRAQHTRTRIADKGWRLPRDLRKSAMSEKTSIRGWGCAIMHVDVDERVLGQRGCAGQAKPHVAQNPFTYFRLALQTL